MIRDQLVVALREALAGLGVDPIPERIELEQPARREHGDWSSNVALVSAKVAGRNPRELATEIADRINTSPPAHVLKVDVAGPGFVNFHLADSWLHDILGEVVGLGAERFARHTFGEGTRVNVEFVSANPTGPLHAGHARGACYGDAIARLLEQCGYTVMREFYINDRGTQMTNYAASLAARRAGDEPPDDGYHGEYIVRWAAEMPADADPLEWGYARARADQADTLGRIGVEFDVWFSERSMIDSGAIDETITDLAAHGASYTADGATWLRSTDHGDDKDRVLIKTDGSYTYLLPDIAYHRDKFSRSDRLIDVWGADHHGYVPRMKSAVAALGHDADELEVAITQLVSLQRNGEEVRLSKRAGDIIELADIIDEIGPDATRFTYLLQSVDSTQNFDLAVAASAAMENPVFYVQMAHARLCSIQQRVAEAGIATAALADVELTLLEHERELEILRSLFTLPDTVALACRERAPHKITTWLRDHASAVHGFYHDCYVMGDGVSPELTQARLWLVEAARIGLATGLDLVGVHAPESM